MDVLGCRKPSARIKKGANYSNLGSTKSNWQCGKSRIRTNGCEIRNVSGGRIGKTRNYLGELGIRLTNREVYNYFKDCNVAESRKLADIVGGALPNHRIYGRFGRVGKWDFSRKIPIS